MSLMTHFEFITKPLEYLVDELGAVIVDDSSGHTKVVEHMMFDELDHIWDLYFQQGNNFNLIRDVICYV